MPFDHARVVLAPSGGVADDLDGADYINASFVKLPHDAGAVLDDVDAGSRRINADDDADGFTKVER